MQTQFLRVLNVCGNSGGVGGSDSGNGDGGSDGGGSVMDLLV